VAAGAARFLQAVPASRHCGPADPDPAGQAQGAAAAAGSLSVEEITTILAACERLRDRFLFALLAETGMRIGQALGLRHADFVSRRREVAIVPRADNANGARAKTRTITTLPVSAPLVRLYSDYMHTEFGGLDSDYVFVNLWAAPVGGHCATRRSPSSSPGCGRPPGSSSPRICCATPGRPS
jgi:integrase